MQRLTYATMKALVMKKQAGELPSTCILDVRGTDEFAGGAIPSAANVPLDQLESALKLSTEEFKNKYKVAKPEKNDHVVTYCLKGGRAEKAAHALTADGYTNVDFYPGSWTEWSQMEKDL
jgi:thiosulfate:glutathione sulfurtransferase